MTTRRMFLVLAFCTTLAACNTIHGIGADLEATGEAISGSADETKEKLR